MNTRFLVLAIIILIIEIFIAIYIKDAFIRPFFGDFLAVIWVYFLLRIFSKNELGSALLSLVIAFCVEALQYFEFLKWSGWIKYKVLAIIMGNSFSWWDMLAYFIGFLAIVFLEYYAVIKFLFKTQFKSHSA